ncbi:MAG: hypothetical protein KAJ51_03960 [Thermoplasmata archaeon]|nr:hypothetical protein [Thermoplasmata archaeon]
MNERRHGQYGNNDQNYSQQDPYSYSDSPQYNYQAQPPQPSPPPYQGYPQYPYYPPPYPPQGPESDKNIKLIVVIVVVIIIIFVVLPVVAGVLYVWSSGFSETGSGGMVKITGINVEGNSAFIITIASVYGGDLNLEDARFQISDDNDVRILSAQTGSANPTSISKGQSTIFPIPSGSTAVQDSTTGSMVTGNSDLNDYTDCYIAYVDEFSNGKLDSGDSIWIYKDWTSDGTQDIQSRYTFKILDADHEMVLKKQL